ncbi:MAG TPA: hypothetical protein VGM73_06615 [Candidatus Didemnitutus sp.]
MNATALLILAAAVVTPKPVVTDWANPPFDIVAGNVDLTVGQDMSLVSARYIFKYVEAEDADHAARVFIHYPFYAPADSADWQDAANTADLKLEVKGQTLRPIAGSRIDYSSLTEFPIVDNAQVFVATFEVPRSMARVRFEGTISHVQSNFHYRGDTVSLFTPWLPRVEKKPHLFHDGDRDFTVTVHAMSGLACRLISPNAKVIENSPAEIVVVSEHRQSVAVAVQPAPAAPKAP